MNAYERLTIFLYILLRDELPVGTVEKILVDHVDKATYGVVNFSNPELERLALSMAHRIWGS